MKTIYERTCRLSGIEVVRKGKVSASKVNLIKAWLRLPRCNTGPRDSLLIVGYVSYGSEGSLQRTS